LLDVVVNESFGFKQLTNIGHPFIDGDGGSHVYDEAWLFVEGEGWVLYGVQTLTQDDTEIQAKFAEAALREKNTVRQAYNVTTPFWTPAYRLGDRIRLVGQRDAEIGKHQIMSLSYSLGDDHNTVLATDTNSPMVASQVLGGSM
jgi:hypothetical protein